MRKILIAATVVAVAGYGAVRWSADAPGVDESSEGRLLKDRVWIDHLPQHDRDRVNLFVALTARPPRQGPPGPFGMFEKIGPWEGHFQAFRYESHGDEMRIMFPQSGDRETLHVHATACNEHGMDYCLEIEGSSRGVKRYYSRKNWIVRSVDEAETLARSLIK